ncbi:cation diffusion facilitator family transporter [Sulfurihydrogenibium azorense Az-Fu1]|uniref:Cation diffusion facilitator family transporter n=1 Tax=Sulfurihydrogenibium azorense (strain DSM 15241 / OCM 825 / Az-Fu1) TaxID=204536 RepID=C1DXP2_SULAA|nr:cation diffusion facilitator family transporter [Sulfurihydrogenibium azorense]ACN99788.1 cation diffusion facilitator family transporter [Sulfurihydrogenibium azorense Az-Fu1]
MNQKLKERWILGSLLLNLFLSVLKLVFGLITNSLGLIAEAIHSFSDLVASVISFIGVKLSAKKSEDFPYGLYKIENIAALIISLFLFLAGYEIIKEAFFHHEERQVSNPEYAIIVMAVAMILTFFYSRFEKQAGKKLNSPTLIADAEHIWADFLSSVIVLIGLIGVYFGYNIDKYAAAVVSLFIFHSGFEIMKDSIKVLLDFTLEKEELQKIKNIVLKHPAIVDIKSIKGRSAGSYKFLEIELLMHNLSLREAHRIVDEIAQQIKEKIPNIDSVIIHYEPARQEGLRVAFLTDKEGNIKDFETATYMTVFDITKDFEIVRNPPIKLSDNKSKIIENSRADVIVSKNHPLDFGIRFSLSRSSIMVWETEKQKIEDALQEVIKSWKEFINKEGKS